MFFRFRRCASLAPLGDQMSSTLQHVRVGPRVAFFSRLFAQLSMLGSAVSHLRRVATEAVGGRFPVFLHAIVRRFAQRTLFAFGSTWRTWHYFSLISKTCRLSELSPCRIREDRESRPEGFRDVSAMNQRPQREAARQGRRNLLIALTRPARFDASPHHRTERPEALHAPQDLTSIRPASTAEQWVAIRIAPHANSRPCRNRKNP